MNRFLLFLCVLHLFSCCCYRQAIYITVFQENAGADADVSTEQEEDVNTPLAESQEERQVAPKSD